MNHADIEPTLQPWMERHARNAPDDLLLRVMTGLDSMPQDMTWRSRINASSVVGMITAGVAALAIALAMTLFVTILIGPRIGGPDTSASPEATPSIIRTASDAVGDAPDGAPDIVSVTMSLTRDAELALEVELAQPLRTGDWLVISLETNGGGPLIGLRPAPMDDFTACSSWWSEANIEVMANGRVYLNGDFVAENAADGDLVMVTIPLEELGITDWLGLIFGATAGDGEWDLFPEMGQGCYPLIWPEASTP